MLFFFFLMIRRPPRSTLSSSSAASDVYKRQKQERSTSHMRKGRCVVGDALVVHGGANKGAAVLVLTLGLLVGDVGVLVVVGVLGADLEVVGWALADVVGVGLLVGEVVHDRLAGLTSVEEVVLDALGLGLGLTGAEGVVSGGDGNEHHKEKQESDSLHWGFQ
eukprot:TRINITY_DN1091_c0_g1_i3.p1 TRINITY_DN1091_c0_g1~~TRINITY_DN1091_c0_g1_i3.p1  ORF type:complete len:163 (-),score=45.87 TRINITY_DN1091_c0_g1_i3:217-705(-)